MRRALWPFVPALVMSACGPRPGVKCGNQSCPKGQICDVATTLCVDDENPKVTLSAPRDGELLSGFSLAVRATVTDDSGPLQLIEVSLGNGEWRPVDAPNGEVNVTLDVEPLDARPLIVRVRATDAIGQTDVATATPTIDNVAPACTAEGIADGQTLALADGPAFTLRFAATDGSGKILQSEVSVDDGTTFQPATLEGNIARWEWTLPTENGIRHGIRFRARDEAGNECTVALGAVVDTVAPTVSILSPDAGTLLGPASMSTVTVSGTATDETRPVQLTVSLDGAPDGGVAKPGLGANGDWAIELPLPQDDYVERTITATVVDGAGNNAQDVRRVRIDRVAPSVTFTSPANGARFNIASFSQADGGSTDDVEITFLVNDGDTSRRVEASVNQGGFAPAQSPLTVRTSPTDNGQTYQIEVRVTDTAGNQASVVHRFYVDRVRPAVAQVNPEDRQRLTAPAVTIVFTEPIDTANSPTPVTFTPAASGTWVSNTTYRASLANDTVYSASIAAGAAKDLFGNTNVVTKIWSFHTEPKAPTSGVLLSNVVRFKALHDLDGVAYVAAESPNQSVTVHWIEPRTGVLTQTVLQTMKGQIGSTNYDSVDVAAWRTVKPDLSAHRIVGLTSTVVSCSQPPPPNPPQCTTNSSTGWLVDGIINSQLPSGYRLIPIPPGCTETNALETATLKVVADGPGSYRSMYWRGSSFQQYLDFFAEAVNYDTSVWTAWYANGSNLEVQSWGCSTNVFGQCSCGIGNSFNRFTDLGAPARISTLLASNGDGSIWVYNNNAGSRTEVCNLCVRLVPGGFCQLGNNLTRTHPAAENLRVARRDTGTRVIASRIFSSPPRIEVLERDMAPDCQSTWTSLGTVALSQTVAPDNHQPVMFGTHPGVIYLEGTALKAYVVP